MELFAVELVAGFLIGFTVAALCASCKERDEVKSKTDRRN